MPQVGGGEDGGPDHPFRAFVQNVLEAPSPVKSASNEPSVVGPAGMRTGGAAIEELRSGGRRLVISKAREEFVQVAVKELGFSGAEVARYIGVTASCVIEDRGEPGIAGGGYVRISDLLIMFCTNVPLVSFCPLFSSCHGFPSRPSCMLA